MNKNFKYYLGIWAILLLIFNIAVFVSPNEAAGLSKFGGAFFTGYIFITLAFIGQLAASYFAFTAKNIQKLFYKIPLISISWKGLVLTLIAGTVCMVIPNLPNWIGIIACFVILGFNAISLVKASAAAEIISATDDKIKSQTSFIKSLTVDAEGLIARAQSETAKSAAKKVYEAVRYSDPMSNEALSVIEAKITVKVDEFAAAVSADDAEKSKEIADEIVILVGDRNKKCKALK